MEVDRTELKFLVQGYEEMVRALSSKKYYELVMEPITDPIWLEDQNPATMPSAWTIEPYSNFLTFLKSNREKLYELASRIESENKPTVPVWDSNWNTNYWIPKALYTEMLYFVKLYVEMIYPIVGRITKMNVGDGWIPHSVKYPLRTREGVDTPYGTVTHQFSNDQYLTVAKYMQEIYERELKFKTYAELKK